MARERFTVRRISVDVQGYDSNGSYWGAGGDPLFWYCNDDCTIERFLRYHDITALRNHLREKYPNCTFAR